MYFNNITITDESDQRCFCLLKVVPRQGLWLGNFLKMNHFLIALRFLVEKVRIWKFELQLVRFLHLTNSRHISVQFLTKNWENIFWENETAQIIREAAKSKQIYTYYTTPQDRSFVAIWCWLNTLTLSWKGIKLWKVLWYNSLFYIYDIKRNISNKPCRNIYISDVSTGSRGLIRLTVEGSELKSIGTTRCVTMVHWYT